MIIMTSAHSEIGELWFCNGRSAGERRETPFWLPSAQSNTCITAGVVRNREMKGAIVTSRKGVRSGRSKETFVEQSLNVKNCSSSSGHLRLQQQFDPSLTPMLKCPTLQPKNANMQLSTETVLVFTAICSCTGAQFVL